MKRIICLFLICLLLCSQAFAGPTDTLEGRVRDFMAENGLNEKNFSVSIYFHKTQETFALNAQTFVPVGRLWTLPLHMYYYEQETLGAYEPTPEHPEPFTIGGMSLEDCRYHSIILNEEAVSEKMRAQVGTLMQYQEIVNNAYGSIDPDRLSTEYWNGDALSTEYLMNCLRAISSRPERFGNLMANFRMVQTADALADSSVPYPVVQIRGEEGEYIAAVAEVSAPSPYLIVAWVKNAEKGDELLAALNGVVCEYSTDSAGIRPTETQTPTERDNSKYYIGEERLEKDNTLTQWFVLAFGVAGVIALIGLVIFLVWRSKNRRY